MLVDINSDVLYEAAATEVSNLAAVSTYITWSRAMRRGGVCIIYCTRGSSWSSNRDEPGGRGRRSAASVTRRHLSFASARARRTSRVMTKDHITRTRQRSFRRNLYQNNCLKFLSDKIQVRLHDSMIVHN